MKDEVAIIKEKKADQSKNKDTYTYQDILASIGYSLPKSYKQTTFNLINQSVNKEIDRPMKLVSYECVICKTRWEGLKAGGNQCPKCNDFLYTKLV